MANNKGGQIVFGIKDSPHIPLGMTNMKFTELDPKDFENQITQYFSPAIEWTMDTEMYDGKLFGVITVKEAADSYGGINKSAVYLNPQSSLNETLGGGGTGGNTGGGSNTNDTNPTDNGCDNTGGDNGGGSNTNDTNGTNSGGGANTNRTDRTNRQRGLQQMLRALFLCPYRGIA